MNCLYIERHCSPFNTTTIHVWVEVCCSIPIVTKSSSSSSSSFSYFALGHLFTCSGLIHSVVSSVVSPGSFCLLVCSFLLSSIICHKAFCLHAVSSFSCSPAFCPKLWLYLISLQYLYLFYNLASQWSTTHIEAILVSEECLLIQKYNSVSVTMKVII